MDKFELEHTNIEQQLIYDKKIINTLAQHTPMLYFLNSEKKNRKEGVASSLYLKYSNKEYLVTVGHVFENYEIDNIFINIIDVKLKSLENGIIFLPKDKADNFTEMDYSIFLINDEISQKMHEVYKPVVIKDWIKQYQYTSIWNFVFGYPETKNRFNSIFVYPKATYLCLRLPTCFEVPNKINIDDNKNIVMIYDKDIIVETQNIFNKIFYRPPKLNGLSGCGIWAVPDYPFDANKYMLQGMLTSYHDEHKIIIGFRIQDIAAMLELIENHFYIEGNKGFTMSVRK